MIIEGMDRKKERRKERLAQLYIVVIIQK